jgi:hypothetical protein
MTTEYSPILAPKKPCEEFGLTNEEQLFYRVSQKRFEEIFADNQTIIHDIRESENDFGEFLFVTTSRPGNQSRIGMTFYSLGFHDPRERWITQEWFWYHSYLQPDKLEEKIEKDEAKNIIQRRRESIRPLPSPTTQTWRGNLFELLADLTDEDGALAEMEDLESLDLWHRELDIRTPSEEPPPTGEDLLNQEIREKLPPLRSGEELGLEALAQVKFYTPDSDWIWYASEFDGEDTFFGLVSGFELEFGNFSLSELQEIRGPLGLLIERDVHFAPKKLRELLEKHRQQRGY